jgi:hypothetical protein
MLPFLETEIDNTWEIDYRNRFINISKRIADKFSDDVMPELDLYVEMADLKIVLDLTQEKIDTKEKELKMLSEALYQDTNALDEVERDLVRFRRIAEKIKKELEVGSQSIINKLFLQ